MPDFLDIFMKMEALAQFCCRADQPLLCSLEHLCFMRRLIRRATHENDKTMFRFFKLQ